MPKCPLCHCPYEVSECPPFCGRRCKLLDLDNWLGGRYVVSQQLPFDEEVDALPPELLEALYRAREGAHDE